MKYFTLTIVFILTIATGYATDCTSSSKYKSDFIDLQPNATLVEMSTAQTKQFMASYNKKVSIPQKADVIVVAVIPSLPVYGLMLFVDDCATKFAVFPSQQFISLFGGEAL